MEHSNNDREKKNMNRPNSWVTTQAQALDMEYSNNDRKKSAQTSQTELLSHNTGTSTGYGTLTMTEKNGLHTAPTELVGHNTGTGTGYGIF